MSAPLQDFVDAAVAADIVIHSLEVSQAGRTLVSAGVAPFGPQTPHRTYSVSKTITAIAVLLLAEEGRLRLDDPIVAHFPEMAPVHAWLAATRIDDMLAMRGPHSRTTYDVDGAGWLESYFRVTPTHRPGTLFTYDTSASYVLSALVERLAGTNMHEYLLSRLLAPLGIGDGMRWLTGPEGISHGGSGLIAKPRDLLRIAEAVNGTRTVLPASVRERLLERRSDPATQTWGATLRAGYGRQVWLPGHGCWLMFGLGGQLVLGDPARELAAVVAADTSAVASGDQRFVDLAIRAFMADPVDPVRLAPPSPRHDPASARPLCGEFSLVTGEGAAQRLVARIDADGGEVDGIRFDTAGPLVGRTPMGDAVVTAGWSAPGVLDVRVSAAADDIASQRLRLVVADGFLTIQSDRFGPLAPHSSRATYRPALRVSP